MWYLCPAEINSQHDINIKWRNPVNESFQVIEGQSWHGQQQTPYDRLPIQAQQSVRTPVWDLSKHAAGLVIRFNTNAQNIIVRYTVSGNHAMNHMPATGVSGVDLYALTEDDNWLWCRGNRNFSDTITYAYNNLTSADYEYRLFLPLYNQVTWLEIGVPQEDELTLLPIREQAPMVVYGTSIAQGGCASRPGMGWTNIVSRELNRPLINLAFSGNGRLEPELIELIAEINASVYVLDCLPNLTDAELYPEQELTKRINQAVRTLKMHRPNTPILLVEHAGYTDGLIQEQRKRDYQRVNRIQKNVFEQLKKDNVTGLHYLSHDEINLQLDDMVDGTHPNDLGMMHYAEAYKEALTAVFQK
ncbi:MAG: hypothetical protein DHS20C17_34520 [Cyclobacteriaceae bacterium]|nr:MAG: hypothetical protein DHS20C17_34520 [Cyclobacteriaceae bacterium]